MIKTKFRALSALLVGLSLAFGSVSVVQAAPTKMAESAAQPEIKAKKMTLMKSLNLTKDQKAQVKTIRAEAKTQRDAVKADTALAPKDRRAKNKTIKEATDAKIVALLTPAQKKTYDEWQANKQAERDAKKAAKKAAAAKPAAPKA